MKNTHILLLALVLSGCVYQGKSKKAGTDLEKAIRFVEIDERDRSFDLSKTGKTGDALLDSTTEAKRVPDPRQVDLNSSIQVLIDPNKLRPAEDSDVLTEERSQELLRRKDLILTSLESLSAAIELRGSAVDSFAALQKVKAEGGDVPAARKVFRDARRKFATSEAEAIQGLLEAWKSDPEGFVALDDAAKDDSYGPLQEFLRKEIEKIDRENAALVKEVESRQSHLRLTAYLESGKQRTAVHLPCYDNLGAGEARGRDRMGLDLSPEEMGRLQDQWQKTKDLAAAAEEVRTEQKELRTALEEQARSLAPNLGAVLDAAAALEASIHDIPIQEMLRETRDDLQALADAVEASAETLGDSVAKRARNFPKTWAPRVEALGEVYAIVDEVRELADAWKAVKAEQVLDLAWRTSDLATRVSNVLKKVKGMTALNDGKTAFRDVLDSNLRGLAAEAIAQVEGLVDEAANTRLSTNFDRLHKIWVAGQALAETIDDFVGDLAQPVEGHIPSPHAFRIPVDDVKDTYIDLTRTPRQEGDRLSFRAELFRAGAEEPSDEMEASFEPEYFGWHARLSPSVVLVRPTSLANSEEQFAFAPALSWVHRYRPRPEHDEFMDGVARALDPAFGIHAAFVNFDPNTSIEIGLGATLSFWEDRLQLGFGTNLMANDNSGRYYYFVGSDLISLLNTIGIGG